MWKLAMLLLAMAPLWAAAVGSASTPPKVAAADGSQQAHARLEPEGSRSMITKIASYMPEATKLASHGIPFMRREDGGAAALGESVATSDARGREVQNRSGVVASHRRWNLHDADAAAEAAGNAELSLEAGQPGSGPAVVDRLDTFTDLLGVGRVPDGHRPALGIMALFLVIASCFLMYYLYQQRVVSKEVQQAAIRRRMMRMHSAAAAASADGKPLPETRGPEGYQGIGKGVGGKAGGKVGGKAGGKASGKAGEKSGGKAIGKGAPPAEAGFVASLMASFTGVFEPNSRGGKTGGKATGKGVPLEHATTARDVVSAQTLLGEAAGLGFGTNRKHHKRQYDVLDDAVTTSSETSMPRETQSGPRASKGKGSTKATDAKLQDLLSILRAVERIQAMWRCWKAAQKVPRLNQRITFVCNVREGRDMPNVNRFGGCDPFVECRIVHGDPTYLLRGDVDKASLHTAQTDVKRNELAPRWNQRLTLPDLVYEKDLHVQLVLWDYNLMQNHPVGHVALPLERALVGHGPRRPDRSLRFSPLLGSEELALSATVSAKFSFWEECRHRLVVVAGSWLPKVKMIGTISSYIEARVLTDDPRKASCPECLWSGRTCVVNDNVDPRYEHEFDFTLSCDVASLWLQLMLWDTNSAQNLPDVPIGHVVVKISQASRPRLAGDLIDHELRIEQLPDPGVATDLSRAKLAIRIGCEPQ